MEDSSEIQASKTMIPSGYCETDLNGDEELPQPQAPDTTPKSSHYIWYLKVFFDVGYYLLVIPFHLTLKYDRSTGLKTFKLHTNRLQQATCIVIQAIVIFELFSILRLLPSFNEMHKKPLNILQSGNIVASLIYTLSLVYMFSFKQQSIKTICEQLQDAGTLPVAENSGKWRKFQVKLLSYTICTAAYLMAMTHPVIHEAFVFETNFASFFDRMSMQAKACFLMTDLQDDNAHQHHLHDWRAVPAFVFTCIHTLILIPSAVLVHMLDLFALLTTICCWDVMGNFMTRCCEAEQSVQSGEQYLPSIISHYHALKRLFKSVNEGVGLLFLCCIGISLPIYSTWIAVQFFHNTIQTFDAIHFYVYFVTFLFVISMAARINQKANDFYDWIGSSDLHTLIPTNKMTVLMMDFYSNRIALSGCGIFVINFRFLVTIMSIIVTYTSIIIQFQISRSESLVDKAGNYSGETARFESLIA